MIAYFDTGGLLKIFVEEARSAESRNWARAADSIAVSRVTLPEASSAIGRRHRKGDLALRPARRLLREIARFWHAATIVDLNEVYAADLAFQHGLTGFDSIQLAAALTVRDESRDHALVFASFDVALNRAARLEGLTVLEPLD